MTLDVRTMCLGALSVTKASGYELQKLFKEGPFGHFLEASYGSIYPALNKLTDEGLVTCSQKAQDGRPDKKIYSVTPCGHEALSDALAKWPADDKFRSEFLFFMSFADLMSDDQILRLVNERVAASRAKLTLLKESEHEVRSSGQEFVRGYGQAMLEASLKYLHDNRSVIEGPCLQNNMTADQTIKKTNGTPPTNSPTLPMEVD